MAEATIHQGRNVKRFREMAGMKQDALAAALGDDWNQQKVSLLEQREVIDNAILEDVAKILKVPTQAIKSLSEDAPINIISNTVNNNDSATGNTLFSYYPTLHINPVEKWIEALDKNEKLYEENKSLYERMLKVEKEKNSLLEKLIENK